MLAQSTRLFTRRLIRPFSSTPPIKIITPQITLDEIDRIVRPNSKPFFEYVFTKPNWAPTKESTFKLIIDFFTFRRNLYGHGLARYGYRNTDVVMNISGKGDDLVNFFQPVDYFFGPSRPGNPQAGIAQRSFISIRCDDVDPETIVKLDNCYCRTAQEFKEGKAKFSLLTSMLTNPFRPLFHASEQGNCAYWTSKAFVSAGILPSISNWPLLIFFRLLYRLSTTNPNDMNVVLFHSIHHKNQPKGALIFPFYWLNHKYRNIWNLDRFATVIVEPVQVDEDTYKLEVRENPEGRQFWLKVQKDLLKIKKIKKEFARKF